MLGRAVRELDRMPRLKVIFLVDDDPIARRLLARLLARPGWSFRLFADAQEAWKALDDLLPDLVISDLCMPGVDGLTFLAAVGDRVPAVRTILVSGGDMPPAAHRALRDGTLDALAAKPFDAMLVGMARQLLGEPADEPSGDWLSPTG